MAFEVRENDREIVIQVVPADEIFFKVLAAPDRKRRFALGVHDIDRCDGREAVVGGCFQVIGGARAASAVGGVALHDRAVDLFHQLADQRRLEEIAAARFPGREFDGHPAFGFAAEGLVDFDQILRIDLPDKINPGRDLRRAVRTVRLPAGGGQQQDGACRDCYSQFFHGGSDFNCRFVHVTKLSADNGSFLTRITGIATPIPVFGANRSCAWSARCGCGRCRCP